MNHFKSDVKTQLPSSIADVIAWLEREPRTAATIENHSRAQILRMLWAGKRGAVSRVLASLHALTSFAGAHARIQITEASLSGFAALATSSVGAAVATLTDAKKPYVTKHAGPRGPGGVPTANVLTLTATFESDMARLKEDGRLNLDAAIAVTIASWFDAATGYADISSAKVLAAGAGSNAGALDEAAIRSTVRQMMHDCQLACEGTGLLTFAGWLGEGKSAFASEPFRRTRSQKDNVDGSGDRDGFGDRFSGDRDDTGDRSSGDRNDSGGTYKDYITNSSRPSSFASAANSTTTTAVSSSSVSSSVGPSERGSIQRVSRDNGQPTSPPPSSGRTGAVSVRAGMPPPLVTRTRVAGTDGRPARTSWSKSIGRLQTMAASRLGLAWRSSAPR